MGPPLRGNNHVLFTPHPAPPRRVNTQLIPKSQARLKHGLASALQLWMLMAIQLNAMPEWMRKNPIVWPIPGVGHHLARLILDRARYASRASVIKGGILRFADNLVNTLHFFGRLAKD